MQMYPRLFHQHRISDSFRQAERRIFQELERCGVPGFARYEWQRKRSSGQSLQLDFALWLQGIGRFGLQVKGGGITTSPTGNGTAGRGRRGPYVRVDKCPLAITADATMSLLNEVAETLGRASYFIPVLVFPDMEPDAAISKWAKRSNVHLVWRTDPLRDPPSLRSPGRVHVRRPPEASDIRREVEIVTDGQVRYWERPAADLLIPHARRVQIHIQAPTTESTSKNREVRNMRNM